MSQITDALPNADEIVVNGKSYTISGLTLGDYNLVSMRAKKCLRSELIEKKETLSLLFGIESKETDDVKVELESDIATLARKITGKMSDQDIQDYMRTIEGSMYCIYVCVAKNHPDIDEEAFVRQLSNEDFTAVQAIFSEVNDVGAPNAKKRKKGRRPNR